MNYSDWTKAAFGKEVPAPGVLFSMSFRGDETWGQKAHEALLNVEIEYVEQLIIKLESEGVAGAFVEFGVFQGWWVNHFFEVTEKLGFDREVIGYDSFQGLSAPHPDNDHDFWKEGQYEASLEEVSANVKLRQRRRIQLIPGFFADSLIEDRAMGVGKIAYARIDCDIYEPALDCLRYLESRLSHGAVLVFDDWTHDTNYGETRAFDEWIATVPELEFEFLFFGTWGHFYMRVWHKGKPRA